MKNNNWTIIGNSVQGAQHELDNLPKQDYFDYKEGENKVVAAVSDGHGSLKHFRSKTGAKLAVESAIDVLMDKRVDDLGYLQGKDEIMEDLQSRIKKVIPYKIVKTWRKKVKKYHKDNPFAEDNKAQNKLDKIEEEYGIGTKEKLEAADNDYFLNAYGATLLVVMIIDDLIFYLQLGDGDIVVLAETANEDNENESYFVFEEKKLGSATYSLCMSNPEDYFRVTSDFVNDVEPLLLLMATDGLKNSFPRDELFLGLAKGYKQKIEQTGSDYVERNLATWLKDYSETGCGDDISLALIFPNNQLISETD